MVDDAGEFGAKPREFAGVELAFKDRVLEMIAPGAHDAEDEAEALVVADVVADEVGGAHLCKFGGCEDGDIRKAAEVAAIQRKQVADPMNPHVRGQAGVVNLNAADFVGGDESLPFEIDDQVTVGALYNRIITHFRLRESITLDFSGYPLPRHLFLSGEFPYTSIHMERENQSQKESEQKQRPSDDTLRSNGYRNGDTITFTITTQNGMLISGDFIAEQLERWFEHRYGWKYPSPYVL